jgi:hypothetical protein
MQGGVNQHMIFTAQEKPFSWSRIVLVVLSAGLVAYALNGLLHDDIYIPCKANCEGTHYQGHLAWLMFGAMLSLSAGALLLNVLRFDNKARLILPLVLIVAGLGLGVRTKMLAERDIDAFEQLLRHGETLYSQAKYMEAQKVFYEALLAAKQDVSLAHRAAARGTDSFCTGLFQRAKAELADKDYALALLDIDTALADRTCSKYSAASKWAREMKLKLEHAR